MGTAETENRQVRRMPTFENIVIRAGKNAIRLIRDEGLDISRVKVLAGASGSAKFLVLSGIDRVLAAIFKNRETPVHTLGTSIGAYRMAAFCQENSLEALTVLQERYIAQQYGKGTTREDITRETMKIITAYIPEAAVQGIINNPVMRIGFLANRCKGLLKSENRLLQMAGLGLAAGCNGITRNSLGLFFERALFYNTHFNPPFAGMDQFPLSRYHLTPANFIPALFSSGSIPVAMTGVSDIPGVTGMFRDGGIIDYHLDIPFLPDSDGLVLYPHFYDRIVPGWFDKKLNRNPTPAFMENVVLVAPSPDFVQRLPHKKIPDRTDFKTFYLRDKERIEYWIRTVDMSRVLGDEFAEAIESGQIRQIVKPI